MNAAETEYAAAVKADGRDLPARMDYGRVLRAQKKLADAAKQFDIVLHDTADPRQALAAMIQIAEMRTEVGNLAGCAHLS